MNTTRRIGPVNRAICSLALGVSFLSPAVEAATTDATLVGPSYKDVAAKYAGDTAALAKLEQKVKSGGSGVWGAIPMPPNNVPDPDLKTLVEWILALK
jgi:cytochrome c551/c552